MIGSKIHHDPRAEPAGRLGVPPVPPHLAIDPDARAAWDALAWRLVGQRVLTDAHGELLAILADGWAQYVRLRREFATGGFRSTIVQEWIDHKGEVRKRTVDNPICRQIRQQALLLNTLFGEFGQTPASAPKVVVQPGASDPFEEFLAGPAQVVSLSRSARAKVRGGR